MSNNIWTSVNDLFDDMPPIISSSESRSILERYMENGMPCIGSSSSYTNNACGPLPITLPSNLSPEASSVNALINDLFQAVTTNDVPKCLSCEDGTAASSTCKDCSELLCDPCLRAHRRVRITKDHRIVKFANDVNNIPDCLSTIGSTSQASNAPCTSTAVGSGISVCDLQHEPRLFCENCLAVVCADCRINHPCHQMIRLQTAIESARLMTGKLTKETRSGIIAIREAIDNIQRRTESVEHRAHQVAAHVRDITKRYVTLLEERERELIRRIEDARIVKRNALHAQMENLRISLTKLAKLSDILNEALEGVTGIDIICFNERVSNELKQIHANITDFVPCEDDNIVFIPPDLNLLQAIISLGTLNVSSSNYFLQGRMSGFPFLPPIEPEILLGPLGRPILGAVRPVVVREYRTVSLVLGGTEGEANGQFCRPWGVCCDRVGNIIVADRSNNRIQIFRPNGSFSHQFGSHGTGEGQFDRPAGIAVDPKGHLVISDKDNHRIQIVTMEGNFVLMFGEKGCRDGQFNYPWDVAVNSIGNIVVSDTRNHRVQLFSNEGTFINKYGFDGSNPLWKQFDSPRGVCFSPNGSVIVTDFNNHRIVILDHRFEQGQCLGCEGSGIKEFLRPQGIICDDEGRIIVADSRNHRIQVFEKNGTFLWKIGQLGHGIGEMDRPSGICLNPDGHIIVVDFGNDRVQIF